MTNPQVELPRYQSHKKVWALKIGSLRPAVNTNQESDGSMWMTPEGDGYADIRLSREYVSKHAPKVGGYYVVYEDGYTSFSPADAFENGYSLIPS